MCEVLVKHGFNVEFLDDTNLSDGSYDIRINGVRADLKKLSSHNNIIKKAKYAINNQNAQIVVFEFTEDTPSIRKKLLELQRKGYKFIYYFTGAEDQIYEVL